MGKHYLLNLYGCSSFLLDDELFLVDSIRNAAIVSGATVLKITSHKFDPIGVTAIALLSESHISIHTYPEFGNCYVDIYTCGDAEPKRGCEFIIQELSPKYHKMEFINR